MTKHSCLGLSETGVSSSLSVFGYSPQDAAYTHTGFGAIPRILQPVERGKETERPLDRTLKGWRKSSSCRPPDLALPVEDLAGSGGGQDVLEDGQVAAGLPAEPPRVPAEPPLLHSLPAWTSWC